MNVLNSYDGFSLLLLQMALWPDWNALCLLRQRRQAFHDSSYLENCVKILRAKHLHPPENPDSLFLLSNWTV